MTDKLHGQVLDFFRARMDEHSIVEKCVIFKLGDEFAARVSRRSGMSDVKALISAAYEYSLMDYYNRPAEIKKGCYVIVARPEASFTNAAWERANAEGIGLGQISDFMGALNSEDVAAYVPKWKRAQKEADDNS